MPKSSGSHNKILYIKTTCTAYLKDPQGVKSVFSASSASYRTGLVATHGHTTSAVAGAVQSAHQDALARVQNHAQTNGLQIRYVEYQDQEFTQRS